MAVGFVGLTRRGGLIWLSLFVGFLVVGDGDGVLWCCGEVTELWAFFGLLVWLFVVPGWSFKLAFNGGKRRRQRMLWFVCSGGVLFELRAVRRGCCRNSKLAGNGA